MHSALIKDIFQVFHGSHNVIIESYIISSWFFSLFILLNKFI